jgi:hypothetical protein
MTVPTGVLDPGIMGAHRNGRLSWVVVWNGDGIEEWVRWEDSEPISMAIFSYYDAQVAISVLFFK